jgi:hypothetical protein
VGMSEEFAAHAELDGLGGVGQSGHRSAVVIGDEPF